MPPNLLPLAPSIYTLLPCSRYKLLDPLSYKHHESFSAISTYRAHWPVRLSLAPRRERRRRRHPNAPSSECKQLRVLTRASANGLNSVRRRRERHAHRGYRPRNCLGNTAGQLKVKSFLTKFSAPLSTSMSISNLCSLASSDPVLLSLDTRRQTAVQVGKHTRKRPRTA